MQPQQPYQNPYDFITQHPKKQNAQLVPGLDTNSTTGRAVVIGVLVVILIIVGVVGKSLLSGGNSTSQLLYVVADQAEVARVAALPTSVNSGAVQQQSTTDTSQNIALSITSDQQLLLSYLSKNGVKVSQQQLTGRQNSNVDAQLTSAAANSTYDTVFLGVMLQEFSLYNTDIQTAYNHAAGPTERKLLTDEYQHNQLLIQLIKNSQKALGSANS